MRLVSIGFLVLCILGTNQVDAIAADVQLHLRTRVQPFKGCPDWEQVELTKSLPANQTAIVICDMWNDHWCKSAARRCDVLAHKMEPVIAAARAKGVTIIHAPSDCMNFYKDTPQHRKAQAAPLVQLPQKLELPDPPLPVDSSDGGCDDDPPAKFSKAWTRQHPALTIAEEDYITDKGEEVYRILVQRGIKNLIVCGVHTNMCVLHRTFAIKNMTRWGIRCYLIRDLTDSMYSPKSKPNVSHDAGTALIIEHIEKHWCPTFLSSDLLEK